MFWFRLIINKWAVLSHLGLINLITIYTYIYIYHTIGCLLHGTQGGDMFHADEALFRILLVFRGKSSRRIIYPVPRCTEPITQDLTPCPGGRVS